MSCSGPKSHSVPFLLKLIISKYRYIYSFWGNIDALGGILDILSENALEIVVINFLGDFSVCVGNPDSTIQH
jgi:hypothetical protein